MPVPVAVAPTVLRFEIFEVDLRAGELRRQGRRVKLQGQPFRVLAVLLGHPGELVTRDELRQRLWPTDTFVDFDHGLNSAVARLREALHDSAESPKYIETLPRRGYRFSAFVEKPEELNSRVGIESLVALPLENLSHDPEQEYFSDGLTEALTTSLANIGGLRVVSRTSAMQYKGVRRPLREIAGELQVEGILAGTVLRSGKRVRISVQLVHALTDTNLWAASYERNLRDILALQSEVALDIAREIRVKLEPHERVRLASVRAVNTEAYDAFLKGRYFWYKRTEEGLTKGIEYFNRAIEQDPTYAAAYVGLSDSYVLLALRGVISAKEALPKAKKLARKALKIDSTLGDAYASLAHARLHDWDWAGLDEDFKRAIELNPGHAIAYHWYSEYLAIMARSDEAIVVVKQAQAIDPISPFLRTTLPMAYYRARRYDDAIEHLRKALELDPTHFLLHFRLGQICIQEGMYDEAIEEAQKAVALSGRSTETLAGLGQAYAAAGMRGAMQSVLDELSKRSEQFYVPPYYLGKIYATLGDKDLAFVWLEKAYDERSAEFIELKVEPVFDSLRSDVRFVNLLQRVGFQN